MKREPYIDLSEFIEVEIIRFNKNHRMNKKWYQSLTIWFNLALLAVEVINQVNQIVPLPTEILAYVALLGNVLLRFKTVAPIK